MVTDQDASTFAAAGYPAAWERMTAEWARPEGDDRAWLLYSANYLLRTGGVRWALDPLSLRRRLPSAPAVEPAALAALDLIVLSHRHADHFDPQLLRELKACSARWVIPEFMHAHVQDLDLPAERVIVPQPLEPLRFGGLTLTPFEGLHLEADASRPDGQRGVPAMGYLAEFHGKRWLFPGDTRTYDAGRLPRFGALDGLFAHVWLGRSAALEPEPPLLESFCRFCLDLQPGRIVLTHLDEWGRAEPERWGVHHARQAMMRLQALAPEVPVRFARMGDGIPL
jgi:hypothetical protein